MEDCVMMRDKRSKKPRGFGFITYFNIESVLKVMSMYSSHYINGKWVTPQQGTALEVIDPSTEDAFATISLGGEADTNAAVAAAKRAFPAWSKTPPAERLALVKKIREIYKSRMDDMAAAIS